MKKIFIVLVALLGVLIISVILIPVIFKDDIKQAIQTQLDQTLDANLLFDQEQFSVSLINDFPNISVGLGNIGLTGKGAFEGDTLFFASQFDLTMDVMSVISGDQIKILKIAAKDAILNILIDDNGATNYDIVKPTGDPDTENSNEDAGVLSIAMDQWEFQNATIRYIDDTLPYYLILSGIDHQGSGTFVGDIFNMVSTTYASSFSTGYDGVEYISDKVISGEVTMEMDLEAFKFTFKENQINLNGLSLAFDGWLAMPAADIDMDLTFSGKEVDLKSILSLTPGDYESYLEGVTANGSVSLEGLIKGTYNDELMPAVRTSFSVTNGKINYEEYPVPMEEINIKASFDMPGADLSLASFVIDRYSMLIDGERLNMSLNFKNLDDYQWDLKVDGNADLEKITKIIPLGEMTLRGKINAALATAGKMSDLEAERYNQLPTSGALKVADFFYQSVDLPQGFGISSMVATFDPEKILLTEFRGNAGKTDLNLNGQINNYLGFALSPDEMLTGKMQFISQNVDINEWMTESEGETTTESDTTALSVISIPQNIDFVLAADIGQLNYDNLNIKQFKGELLITNGSIVMNKVNFGLLDGSFVMNGLYDSKGDYPLYSYDLQIKELSIPAAFSSFNTVQKLAPFAEKMQGKFSTNFAIAGALDQTMMPLYETITGEGLIKVAQASLSNVKLISTVSSVTPLKDSDGNVSLKDVLLNAKIEDGRVSVQPFDIKFGGYTTTISGSNSVEGELAYQMKVKSVPTGGAGQAVSTALSSLTGTNGLSLDKVDINLGVSGTFLKPKVGLQGVSPAGSNQSIPITDQAKNLAKEKISEQKQQVVQKVDSAKTVAIDSAKAVVDQQKDAAKEAAQEEVDKAKEKAKDAAKDIFKKKKSGGGR